MDDATGVPLSLLGSQRSLWEECEWVINSSMARLGVFALLRTLPMGICWSLFFTQSAHETFVDGEGGMNREDRVVDFACGVIQRHWRILHLENVNNLATRSEKFRTRRIHQQNRCVRRGEDLMVKHEDAAFVLPTKLKRHDGTAWTHDASGCWYGE